jgi:hypothetical protein
MFLSPRPNLIESDEGFPVEGPGRTGILYKEGEGAMIVDSEVLARAGISGVEELDPSVAGAPRKRAHRRSKTRSPHREHPPGRSFQE